jgi:hypothetical protein
VVGGRLVVAVDDEPGNSQIGVLFQHGAASSGVSEEVLQ